MLFRNGTHIIDGLVYFVPTATDNSNLHVPAVLDLQGMKFSNCKGRNVKTQLNGYSSCREFKIIRNLEEAINGAREFDFQRAGGEVLNGTWYVNEKPGGGTVWGTSHVLMQATFDQDANSGDNEDWGVTFAGNRIFSSIPVATDSLPYGVIIGSSTPARLLLGVEILNNKFIGGRVGRIFRSTNIDSTTERTAIVVQNNHGNIGTSLIQFTQTLDKDVILVTGGNIVSGGASPKLVELADDQEPTITGFGSDIGFADNLNPASSSSTLGPALRTQLVMGINDHNDSKAADVAAESQSLDDDETGVWEVGRAAGFARSETSST